MRSKLRSVLSGRATSSGNRCRTERSTQPSPVCWPDGPGRSPPDVRRRRVRLDRDPWSERALRDQPVGRAWAAPQASPPSPATRPGSGPGTAVAVGIGAIIQRSAPCSPWSRCSGSAPSSSSASGRSETAGRWRRPLTPLPFRGATAASSSKALSWGPPNPKSLVFFAAILPQFVVAQAGPGGATRALGLYLRRDRPRVGQCVGRGGGNRSGLVRAFSSEARDRGRRRWTDDDRGRDPAGVHGPKGLSPADTIG